MSNTEKVELVEETWEEYGLNRTLKALELSKSTWYYHRKEKKSYKEKYRDLKPKVEEIIQKNPEYGYPRIKVELKEEYGIVVNHKVLLNLLNFWDLKILRNARKTKKSGIREAIQEAGEGINLVKKKGQIGFFEVIYTDFTEIPYDGGKRNAQLIAIIGHESKMILGWAVGEHANTDLSLEAWRRTKETFKEYHISLKGLILHQDQDSVFTGNRWVDEILIKDGVRLSYSENGAKGNTYMESFNGHFKCPNRSIFCEAKDSNELREVIKERVQYWNKKRRHSSLDYRTPLNYIREKMSNEEKKS